MWERRAAQSAPDGYTLMFTNLSMAMSPALYSDLAYDPVRDFVSIGIAVLSPTMLVARPDFYAPKATPGPIIDRISEAAGRRSLKRVSEPIDVARGLAR